MVTMVYWYVVDITKYYNAFYPVFFTWLQQPACGKTIKTFTLKYPLYVSQKENSSNPKPGFLGYLMWWSVKSVGTSCQIMQRPNKHSWNISKLPQKQNSTTSPSSKHSNPNFRDDVPPYTHSHWPSKSTEHHWMVKPAGSPHRLRVKSSRIVSHAASSRPSPCLALGC